MKYFLQSLTIFLWALVPLVLTENSEASRQRFVVHGTMSPEFKISTKETKIYYESSPHRGGCFSSGWGFGDYDPRPKTREVKPRVTQKKGESGNKTYEVIVEIDPKMAQDECKYEFRDLFMKLKFKTKGFSEEKVIWFESPDYDKNYSGGQPLSKSEFLTCRMQIREGYRPPEKGLFCLSQSSAEDDRPPFDGPSFFALDSEQEFYKFDLIFEPSDS